MHFNVSPRMQGDWQKLALQLECHTQDTHKQVTHMSKVSSLENSSLRGSNDKKSNERTILNKSTTVKLSLYDFLFFFFFLFVALHFTIFLRFGTFYFYNVHYNVYLDLVISSSYFFTLYQFPFWKKKIILFVYFQYPGLFLFFSL